MHALKMNLKGPVRTDGPEMGLMSNVCVCLCFVCVCVCVCVCVHACVS